MKKENKKEGFSVKPSFPPKDESQRVYPSTENRQFRDTGGRWLSQALFYEYARDGYEPYFTLKGYDSLYKGITFPSLKLIYLSYEHVPGYEYEFAHEVLGGWEHWKFLYEKSMLRNYIKEWREELDIKIKAKGMRVVMDTAICGEGSSRLQAAKYLADKGYAPTRGRPSKKEKEQLLRQESALDDELKDDFERLGLKAVK